MNRLKQLRAAQGLSQAKLGEMLNCTDVTVSRYETGQRDIDSATICKLCEIFGCSADYLLGRSDLPTGGPSEEEQALILAFRRADDRAREIVRLTLAPFIREATDAASGK
ncbi:MAG: helix-turn-helix transcriptional regulator [Oscillospiraceae bacterium]|nr:helix-turn-helix transcriptional regulator [Oscillospiraceae bacterium]